MMCFRTCAGIDIERDTELFERIFDDLMTAVLLRRTAGGSHHYHRRHGFLSSGHDAGGHHCRMPAADTGNSGSHAAFLYTDYSPEYALPGPSGYPGWDSHRKSPRLSQSRQGKSGSDSPHPGSWVGDAYWRTG